MKGCGFHWDESGLLVPLRFMYQRRYNCVLYPSYHSIWRYRLQSTEFDMDQGVFKNDNNYIWDGFKIMTIMVFFFPSYHSTWRYPSPSQPMPLNQLQLLLPYHWTVCAPTKHPPSNHPRSIIFEPLVPNINDKRKSKICKRKNYNPNK